MFSDKFQSTKVGDLHGQRWVFKGHIAQVQRETEHRPGDSRPTLFAITSFLEPEELEDYVESVRATVRTYKSSMNPSLLVVLCLINVFKLVPFPRGEKES